jgi:indolepyruvate ferredoxin oxidoreductase beta subunit
MFPKQAARAAGQLPVFTPYPIPGDVDLVIAGEMAETGRAIEKGFVTPNATTLISSSHRVYSMPEKEALGDGIMDLSKLAEVAARASKQFVCFDMQRAADETDSVISSVLLGAIAASGALPFERQAFEDTIRRTGKAVESNLRGFAAGFDGGGASPSPIKDEAVVKAAPSGPNGQALADRIEAELPAAIHDIALHGALRTLDYQDARYANEYLDTLVAFVKADTADYDYDLTAEVARQLALQMSYEDTIRVADLKIRSERFGRIRAQVGASENQPVRVVEYFHPRIEEFCDTLPSFLGAWILGSSFMQKALAPFFRKGRNLSTTSISGFLFLHGVSKMKRLRRMTYRYGQQQLFINDWLDKVTAAGCDDYGYAMALARCIEIVKGYGDTYERGRTRYLATVGAASVTKNADAVRQLHRAALADENGIVFRDTLAAMEGRR